ncbi:unnamed protein product [Ectocarpus sp. 8 AP-2014]
MQYEYNTSSMAAVLVCVGLPVLFGYHNRQVETAPTAQRVHWRRRLQHATCGVAVTCGYKWFIRDARAVVAILSIACASFLVLHRLRRRLKSVDKLYILLLGPLLRPHEIRGQLPGGFWFMVGSAAAVALFSKDVALQSILHLSLGDPVASVVGIKKGEGNRIMPGGKSLAGSLAAFLACSLSTLLLFGCCCCPPGDEGRDSDHVGDSDLLSSLIFGHFSACTAVGRGGRDSGGSGTPLLLWFALLGGVSGAVGELLPLGVDDNLSMPIVSGLTFLALRKCSTFDGPG